MQKMGSSFLLETEIIQKSGIEPHHKRRCRCFCLNSILVYKVFVTEKGIFRSCGEIKGSSIRKWFSFDDFLQEVDENSEKRTILVENLVENR
jgi:hypothetical protein